VAEQRMMMMPVLSTDLLDSLLTADPDLKMGYTLQRVTRFRIR
jgi:hypothetical protein